MMTLLVLLKGQQWWIFWPEMFMRLPGNLLSLISAPFFAGFFVFCGVMASYGVKLDILDKLDKLWISFWCEKQLHNQLQMTMVDNGRMVRPYGEKSLHLASPQDFLLWMIFVQVMNSSVIGPFFPTLGFLSMSMFCTFVYNPAHWLFRCLRSIVPSDCSFYSARTS